ncbi:MAG: hypothetical protein EA400_14505 [Chromatiaceae bacterium]|nr:MAG: hypothetical protein EA400_14505 [Chromatiaceae bacterium]
MMPTRRPALALTMILSAALASLAGLALAHDDAYLDRIDGPHGGQLRVAGDHHLELVVAPPADAPPSLQPIQVWLTNHADQPIPSSDYSGRAVILANRERVDVTLVADGDNRLAGSGVFGHDLDMVVVVTLNTPQGDTEQVRFTPYKYLDGSPRAAGAGHGGHADHQGH